MDDSEKRDITNEVNLILKSRGEFISKNYLKIRYQYNNGYNLPELDTLRHEICLDILFGLYQSAMTLTNHLLEAFPKFALIYKEWGDSLTNIPDEKKKPDISKMIQEFTIELKPFMDKYNGKDLNFTINKACTVGLITKEEKKILHEFREDFRNAYSHADRKKQHGDVTVPVQPATFENGDFKFGPEVEAALYDLPIFQGIAQWHHAELYSIPYFEYLDKLIRKTLPKIFPDINKNILEDE